MPWSETGTIQYHAQLRLQTKVLQSKGWLSATVGVLVRVYLLNGLRCYQPSPKVLIRTIYILRIHISVQEYE